MPFLEVAPVRHRRGRNPEGEKACGGLHRPRLALEPRGDERCAETSAGIFLEKCCKHQQQTANLLKNIGADATEKGPKCCRLLCVTTTAAGFAGSEGIADRASAQACARRDPRSAALRRAAPCIRLSALRLSCEALQVTLAARKRGSFHPLRICFGGKL